MNFFPVRFDRSHEKVRPARSTSTARLDERSDEEDVSYLMDRDRALFLLKESQLNQWQNRDQLAQRLCQLLEDPQVRMLRIDMSQVGWLDGDSLAQFARIHCKASQLGKQVILENVCEAVREIFHLTRFDRVVGPVDERGVSRLAGWVHETTAGADARR